MGFEHELAERQNVKLTVGPTMPPLMGRHLVLGVCHVHCSTSFAQVYIEIVAVVEIVGENPYIFDNLI